MALLAVGGYYGWKYYKIYQKTELKEQKIKACDNAYKIKELKNVPFLNTNDYTNYMHCYAKVAIETENVSVCDKFGSSEYPKRSSYVLECYVLFGIKNNDLSVCQSFKGTTDSDGNDLKYDQECEKRISRDIQYLDKNSIYINPIKQGNVKILTPVAGDVLDKDKKYKITWETDNFTDSDVIDRVCLNQYGTTFCGSNMFITFDNLPAKQGYLYFVPSAVWFMDGSEKGISGGNLLMKNTKYYIYLDAGGDPNNDDPNLEGTSDLFEFK